MKRPLQSIVAIAVMLLVASPAIAQNNVGRATRYIYFWDVTSSLISKNNASLRDKTFDFLLDDVEDIVRDNEVIIHPFNDKLLESYSFRAGEKFDKSALRKTGEGLVETHGEAFNNNKGAQNYQEMQNGGGYTNVGVATRKAAEYFEDSSYNNIVILVTDGANEYSYEVQPTSPKLKGGEGRAELRKGIEAADRAARENNKTVNRFYYVAFGDDDPYKPHKENETQTETDLMEAKEKLEKGEKTKIIYPGDKRIEIKFYGIRAECLEKNSQGGEVYHMNSRDTSLEIKISGNKELKEPIDLEVVCRGGCLDGNKDGNKEYIKTFKVDANTDSITFEGLKIMKMEEKRGEFDVTMQIVGKKNYDSANLYYDVYMENSYNGKVHTKVGVTGQFLGTIKVSLK